MQLDHLRTDTSTAACHAKHCTVRVASYTITDTGLQMKTIGSGAIISKDGKIITAAHNVMDPKTGMLYGTRVLIGVLTDSEESTEWKFEAEVRTPLELLSKRWENNRQKSQLIDVAVLQISASVTCTPALFSWPLRPVCIDTRGEFLGGLKWLEIAGTALTVGADDMQVLGYPCLKANGIVVDRKVCSAREDGCYKVDATNIAGNGMSGGPALNMHWQVVGVMSYDTAASRLSHIRDIKVLHLPSYDLPDPCHLPQDPMLALVADLAARVQHLEIEARQLHAAFGDGGVHVAGPVLSQGERQGHLSSERNVIQLSPERQLQTVGEDVCTGEAMHRKLIEDSKSCDPRTAVRKLLSRESSLDLWQPRTPDRTSLLNTWVQSQKS